jgi:hypothetical protein
MRWMDRDGDWPGLAVLFRKVKHEGMNEAGSQ